MYLSFRLVFQFAIDKKELVVLSNGNSIPVPQILAMMVDLEEDPEWSTSDEVEEEDNDR